MLILASRSAARAAMLADAGVPFTAEAANVDEDAAKAALLARGLSGRDIADALAELKALKVSQRHPQALVLGSDSTVVTADGALIDKASSREKAHAQLTALAGTTHQLHSAAVAARGGTVLWRQVDTARLTMRAFSPAFLDAYLDAEWPTVGGCVGGYRLEGPGVQLFSRIEGSHFTILGLPLLHLLEWLRSVGEMAR